jgi:small subunit ribosomal protein S5
MVENNKVEEDKIELEEEIKEEEPLEEEVDIVKEEEEELKEIEEEGEWIPKTKLGKLVKEGKIGIEDIFNKGYVIREPEIIDYLLPDLEEKLIYVGGSSGKGGGIQRRVIRRTVRVHKSGKRISLSAMVIVGNKKGYFGVGFGKAKTNKEVFRKAALSARKNLFYVRRGCGSWECKCGEEHSIPFSVIGKKGSVIVKLMPAPKGLGLCVSDEIKKIFELIGIQDVRIKSRGQTGTRINFVYAIENALRNLSKYKI